jgi:hypothetical protein
LCYNFIMADEENAASRMLRTALHLGDKMSGQVADRSLKLRRAKRTMQEAVRLLEAGSVQAAHDVLITALAIWEPDE